MTNQARVWWARTALLVGLGWLALQMVLARASGPSASVLGRYAPGYFAVMLVVVLASVAGAVFVLRPGLRKAVEAECFRFKMMVFAAWLPAGLLIEVVGYTLVSAGAQVEWNALFGRSYLLATLAMLLVTLDALRVAVRKPEFWMVVVSAVVTLGLIEAGMRYWIRNVETDEDKQRLYDPAVLDVTKMRFAPHHYEGYIPQPGWISEDYVDRINSLGFRGEEIELPKPSGRYRIVALGGSTTYGTAVSDWRQAYPAQLERVLREDHGYTNVEVVNGGVGGHNSWETLINLQFRVLDLEPDLVILYQNTNDVHSRIVPPPDYRGDNSGRRQMFNTDDIERVRAWPMRIPSVVWRFMAINLGWLDVENLALGRAVSKPCTGSNASRSCLGMTPSEALEANPPIYYERNIRNFVAVSQINDVEVLLLTWAHRSDDWYGNRLEYQAAFAEHNEIIRQLANESGAFFYDFASEMPLDVEYWSDGRHMTAEGNRERAELIAAYIDGAGIISKP